VRFTPADPLSRENPTSGRKKKRNSHKAQPPRQVKEKEAKEGGSYDFWEGEERLQTRHMEGRPPPAEISNLKLRGKGRRERKKTARERDLTYMRKKNRKINQLEKGKKEDDYFHQPRQGKGVAVTISVQK